jgi:mannose-6-phosphate isomerase-like protein (cupin superfamily)
MTTTSRGWGITDVDQIPPVKPDWPPTWKSVRHHFGITAFGVNAVTKNAGNVLIPEHDETASGQQELYFVHRGSVLVTLDGEEHSAPEGSMIAVEPSVRRKIEATGSPTTLLAIGGVPGVAYEIGEWER